MASSRGGDTSMFPWLAKANDTQNRRDSVASDELSHRAGLMYRLGYSEKDCAARLCQRIAWEFDGVARPAKLSDDAVAKIVADTYARKPK